MAALSKKDKLIEEAQKLVLRGQFDKAANAYEQILGMEPGAVNLRQKLAELLIKCGRNDDARKELETIGGHFSKNGFYLKAIAVYKQLQKLFPADISLSITLAELNEKHGLVANALSEYKLVYEFYEKSGMIPEAIDILDRMQNVDPQIIPIKIKLAEAYLQQGMMDKSFAVFSKTASLLLERNDTAMLSRISSRIRQFFPDKPDFMLEILAEQIRQGNAATAVESLQSLLRGTPDNKQLWDLIIQAYEQLKQPQRVKTAFQHYLKFFPTEPTAMLGLISSVTAEQNFAGAIELLDLYEAPLVSAGCSEQLEQIYHSLDKIEPDNTRVIEGLIKLATASGNDSELRALTAKLKPLQPDLGSTDTDSASPESQPAFFEVDEPSLSAGAYNDSPFLEDSALEAAATSNDSPFLEETALEDTVKSVFELPEAELQEVELSPGTTSDVELPEISSDIIELPEEEIEIDFEIDIDDPFSSLEEDAVAASTHDNWLDSVGELFDSVSTAPSGVRFGSEMDNTDMQSHFDLGQAFKEMGLFDEAINEFRQASQDPARRVECLIMQCACLRERGEVEKAVTMLRALLQPGLSEEETCAVKYELASGYEYAGNNEEAAILLNEIHAVLPDFRDITSRLNTANFSQTLDFSDDDLKDF